VHSAAHANKNNFTHPKAVCTHTDKIGTGADAGAGCNVIKLMFSHIDRTGKFVGPVDDSGINSRR